MQTQTGKSTGRIILTALVTGAITMVNTLLIDYCTSRKSSLSYCTQISQPFEKDSLQLRIYNMELLNDGDEMVEDIKGVIQFEQQQVVAFKLKGPPTLTIRDSLAANACNLSVASLNPLEKIAMNFLVAGTPAGSTLPLVDIRAKGISAIGKGCSAWKGRPFPLYAMLLVAVAMAAVVHAFLLGCWAAIKRPGSIHKHI